MYGLADTAPAAVPATVSPYALVSCGFGQKAIISGTGPNTCAFDPATAAEQLWTFPGVYLGMFAGNILPQNLPVNAYPAIAWALILGVGYLIFGKSGGRR